MGWQHTIIKQYGLTLTKAIFNDIFSLNNKTVTYEQYSCGQNGLVDSWRVIFNDYTYGVLAYRTGIPTAHDLPPAPAS